MQRRTWILVANGSRARLFSHEGGDVDLSPVRDFEFPAGRAKGSDLVTDRPGSLQSQGTGHGTRRPRLEPKEAAHERFAQDLAHHLEAGLSHHQYGQLVLVASLPFLGMLNRKLAPAVRDVVKARVERDATLVSVAEVRDLVVPLLRRQRFTALA